MYQVRLCHDQADLASPLTPFEKLRWQFLKDHAHAICHPLSGCYLGTGRRWQLKPTPLAPDVQDPERDATLGFAVIVVKRSERSRKRESERDRDRHKKLLPNPVFRRGKVGRAKKHGVFAP